MNVIYDSINGQNGGWEWIKKIGKAGLINEAPSAYERVEQRCKSVGLYIVPVGEMECFDKTINKEKKNCYFSQTKLCKEIVEWEQLNNIELLDKTVFSVAS